MSEHYFEEEIPKHRKKSLNKSISKSNHKHDYKFDSMVIEDKLMGLISSSNPNEKHVLITFKCSVCGKPGKAISGFYLPEAIASLKKIHNVND